MGRLGTIIYVAQKAALELLACARALRLRVSPKTTIVASDPRAAKAIQSAMTKASLHVAVTNQVRDLGVSFSAHRKRRKGIGAKRLINAMTRLSNIGGWAAKIVRARRLVKAFLLPLGLWGQEASGFTISDLTLLRLHIATASGISSPQRCEVSLPLDLSFSLSLLCFHCVLLCFHGVLVFLCF